MKFISFSWYYFLCVASIVAFEEYGFISSDLKERGEKSFRKHESYKSDFLKADDHGEFDLADIMYLSQSSINENVDAYSSMEKMVLVDIHNIYRSNLTKPFPKGSDLQYVVWNATLAWAAEEWLKECKFERGFGKQDNMTSLQGQNLYKGPSKHPSRALYLWYEEYKNFAFENFTCSSKSQCDHMTQMLWSDSSNIGCARKSNCFPLQPSDILMNCHYFPAGNKWKIGTQMYKYGWPCTRCELPDGNLCFNNLCVDKKSCNAYKLDCECKVNCRHCVKPNYKKCRCEPCKPGWDWQDCSFPCIDLYDLHENKPGFCRWKVQTATKQLCWFSEISNILCRRACGNCTPVNWNFTKDLCCGGKVCQPYHVLDDECNCIKDCPSNICLYPSPDTKHPINLPPRQPSKTFDSDKLYNETTIPIEASKNRTMNSTKLNKVIKKVSKAHNISAVCSDRILFVLLVLLLLQ